MTTATALLDLLDRLPRIQRSMPIPHNSDYNVATHSLNVAFLALLISLDIPALKDQAYKISCIAMVHDFKESLLGDIPYYAKKRLSDFLGKEWDGVENSILKDQFSPVETIEKPNPYSTILDLMTFTVKTENQHPIETKDREMCMEVVDFCDILEFLWWTGKEKVLGNSARELVTSRNNAVLILRGERFAWILRGSTIASDLFRLL